MYLKGLYEFHNFNLYLINIFVFKLNIQHVIGSLKIILFIVSCNFIITMNLIFFQDEELISHQLCF